MYFSQFQLSRSFRYETAPMLVQAIIQSIASSVACLLRKMPLSEPSAIERRTRSAAPGT